RPALARMAGEVVDRHFHGPALAKRLHVLDEQVGLERVGMVVVERGPLFEPQIVARTIVPVVLDQTDLVVAEALDDPADDSRLAGAGPAGDANDEGFHSWSEKLRTMNAEL